jgi:hypothetical protein
LNYSIRSIAGSLIDGEFKSVFVVTDHPSVGQQRTGAYYQDDDAHQDETAFEQDLPAYIPMIFALLSIHIDLCR